MPDSWGVGSGIKGFFRGSEVLLVKLPANEGNDPCLLTEDLDRMRSNGSGVTSTVVGEVGIGVWG